MGILLALRQAIAKQIKRWKRRWVALLISGLLSLGLVGCAEGSQRIRVVELPEIPTVKETRRLSGAVSEVSPPAILLDLDALMSSYQPRVSIVSPKSEQIIDENRIEVLIKVKDFSIYKDENLELGPHLQVMLDQQPAQSVYSLDDPIVFEKLTPGSHTLRVVAVRPWGESFKGERAFAQTTFHVLAATEENTPEPDQPLLTYVEPQGTYSAEPVLLDFYLTNAPLHQVAQESDTDDIVDWQIRGTVNGQSFVFDQWQPIYLKGLVPGQNWVQLTLIDRQGNPIKNAFNSTVHTFNYDPQKRDTLAKIVRGELPIEKVGQIAIASYTPPPAPVIEPPEPSPEPSPETPAISEAAETETQIPETQTPETQTPELPIPNVEETPSKEFELLTDTQPETESADSQENSETSLTEEPASVDGEAIDQPSDSKTSTNTSTAASETSDETLDEAFGSDRPVEDSAPDIQPLSDTESANVRESTSTVESTNTAKQNSLPIADDKEDYSEKILEQEPGLFSQLRERVTTFWEKQRSPKEQSIETLEIPNTDSKGVVDSDDTQDQSDVQKQPEDNNAKPALDDPIEVETQTPSETTDNEALKNSDREDPDSENSELENLYPRTTKLEAPSLDSLGSDSLDSDSLDSDSLDLEYQDELSLQNKPDIEPKVDFEQPSPLTLPDTLSAPAPIEDLPENSLDDLSD